MDIACRLCNSQHTERLALTYSKGTSKSQGWAVSMNLFGPILASLIGMAKFFPQVLGPILGLPVSALAVATGAPFALAVDLMILAVLSSMSVTRMKGTTQSYLAAETAPPPRFRVIANLFRAVFLVAIGTAILAGFIGSSGLGDHVVEPWIVTPIARVFELRTTAEILPLVITVPAVPMVLLAAAFMVMGVRYNRKVWPYREASWQRTFLCKRCGGTFVEPDFDPYGVNKVRSDKAGKGKGEFLPHNETEAEREAVHGKAEQDARYMRGK